FKLRVTPSRCKNPSHSSVSVTPRPGPVGTTSSKILALQCLSRALLGHQQRSEKLCSPYQLWERGKELRAGNSANRAFQHGATVKADTRCMGDRSDAARGVETARLRDLHVKYVRRPDPGKRQDRFRY